MGEDMVQISNNNYIRAQRMLARIGMAFIRVMQLNYERETGRAAPSVESCMIEARDPNVLIEHLERLTKERTDAEAAELAVKGGRGLDALTHHAYAVGRFV